jgi:putative oxidoreductase
VITALVLALPRLVAGLLMTGHGLQKLAGWFGGRGLAGTEAMLTSLRIRPASWWAIALALAETIGGTFMALGLFEPLGQIAVVAVLAVAIAVVHAPRGLWNQDGGYEFPLMLGTVAVATGLAPVGATLDVALGIALPGWLVVIAVITAVVCVGLALAARAEWLHRGRRHAVVESVRYARMRRIHRVSR